MAGVTVTELCDRCGVLDVDVEDGLVVIDEYGIAHLPTEYGTAECGLWEPDDGWRH
jgi:hypothetical protein